MSGAVAACPPPARIRPGRPTDSEALSALVVASVRALGPRAYGPEQIAVWAASAPSPAQLTLSLMAGRARMVAADARDRPLAFADVDPDGRIDLFYAAPQAAGGGLAAALLAAVEAHARARGCVRLTAEASAVARGLFVRAGFTVLERRDFAVAGVAIWDFAVEKRL